MPIVNGTRLISKWALTEIPPTGVFSLQNTLKIRCLSKGTSLDNSVGYKTSVNPACPGKRFFTFYNEFITCFHEF